METGDSGVTLDKDIGSEWGEITRIWKRNKGVGLLT